MFSTRNNRREFPAGLLATAFGRQVTPENVAEVRSQWSNLQDLHAKAHVQYGLKPKRAAPSDRSKCGTSAQHRARMLALVDATHTPKTVAKSASALHFERMLGIGGRKSK